MFRRIQFLIYQEAEEGDKQKKEIRDQEKKKMWELEKLDVSILSLGQVSPAHGT